MSREHRERAVSSLLLSAALLLLAATLVVGCSRSAAYEGTWVQNALPNSGQETPIVIKKVGDKYTFSSPNGETFGYMLHTTPSSAGQASLYAMMLKPDTQAIQAGDELKLANGKDTIEVKVSGNTMTMVVPSVSGAFTFSRVTK